MSFKSSLISTLVSASLIASFAVAANTETPPEGAAVAEFQWMGTISALPVDGDTVTIVPIDAQLKNISLNLDNDGTTVSIDTLRSDTKIVFEVQSTTPGQFVVVPATEIWASSPSNGGFWRLLSNSTVATQINFEGLVENDNERHSVYISGEGIDLSEIVEGQLEGAIVTFKNSVFVTLDTSTI